VPRPDDPRVVLQAHALRTRETRRTLVHGSGSARVSHSNYGALLASVTLGVVVIIIVFVVTKVVGALHR
jgi:ABC-type glycerol-3-phosphate transport system permease component